MTKKDFEAPASFASSVRSPSPAVPRLRHPTRVRVEVPFHDGLRDRVRLSFHLSGHRMSSQKKFNLRGHSLGTVTMKANKKGISFSFANPLNMHGAGGRNRTDTGWKPRGILSPVRLPVSPLRHKYQYKKNYLLCQMKWRSREALNDSPDRMKAILSRGKEW